MINVRRDNRGELREILKGSFAQCNILLMKKGSIWGDHYHRKTKEIFYIVEGKINLELWRKGQRKVIKTYRENESFEIQPKTFHKIIVVKRTKCLVFYSKTFSRTHPDIFY